jgi:hypothetical protein
MRSFAGAIALSLAASSVVNAAPASVNQVAFSAAATTIDFEISDDVEITNQFFSLGITFSGGLLGHAENAFRFADDLVASNFENVNDLKWTPVLGPSG